MLIHVFSATFYHDYLALRLQPDDIRATLDRLENKWTSFNTLRPFEFFFLNEIFDSMYRAEQKLSQVFMIFSAIAIFISCLGLIGLASYSTLQRRKEIGIRKVLGASIPSVVGLLSKDFLKLVGLSIAIGIPLSFYLGQLWLQNFAARVQPGIEIIIYVTVLTISVAFAAIVSQSLKAALMNPVESLRNE